MTTFRPGSRGVRLGAAMIATTAFTALATRAAHAHFELMAPASYSQQNSAGDPQKSAPCGQADPGNPVQPTHALTPYVQGHMLTLTVNETVFHPGHYRVSIARTMAMLPADPPVRAGTTACGSTTIDTTPTLPLLADGLLVHTMAFSAPQTVQIPLPADFTCDNCVVQVVEFMSNHPLNNPGGCFYHHCAMVSVTAATVDGGTRPDSGPTTDATVGDTGTGADVVVASDTGPTATDVVAPRDGATGTTDAGPADSGTHAGSTGGCSCRAPSRSTPWSPAVVASALLGIALTRRRRTSRARGAR